MTNNIRRNFRSFDIILVVLVIALAAFGLLMIGSITGLGDGHVSAIFINQLIFLVTGIAIMLLAAFINFETICKFYLPIFGVNILLLIIVLIIPTEHATVARWIGFTIAGTPMGVQPSEFAKIFTVIFLAAIISKYQDKINNIAVVGMVVGSTALTVGLILLQRSLSASTVPIVIMLAMLFVGKIGYRYIIITMLIVIPAALFFFIELHAENPLLLGEIMEPWQRDRIWSFLYPQAGTDAVFQNEAAQRAFSSGLLTGRGLFTYYEEFPRFFVPEATNDFIFSIVGLEFGFLGTVVLLVLILAIVMRCLLIAYRSKVFLGKLLAVGVATTIAFQTFFHVGVNTWLLPNTGINLPFVSSGGSAMWVFMAMIGLVLNVGMTQEYSMFDDFGGKK
ncbi:MAG: FtsW/RodA/SpoVE family cell cycle protein [Defluviitaleaceae bacterium]|nr:FtsW/RodA/SpoVE family cell cycle protein [Defluviitaleaceae bacterium]